MTDYLEPPYTFKADGFGVEVDFDEEVRSLLPQGVEPLDAMTGGLHIYTTSEAGYGLEPFTACYFYIFVKGMDTPGGEPGRCLLDGIYGPDSRVSASMRHYFGVPVRVGESMIQRDGKNIVGIGTVAGQEVVRIVVTPTSDDFMSTASLVHFPGVPQAPDATGELVVTQMPFIAEVRPVDAISLEVSAPEGDPLHTLRSTKLTGGEVEFKNFSFAWTRPRPARDLAT